jgi:precorrin-8X/cobalt-precorrin-8 methylmutase
MSGEPRTLVERYVLPPDEIEALSLERVDAAVPTLADWPPAERTVVRRMIYAAADPSLAARIRIHPQALEAGAGALRTGCTVVVDVRMVEVALDRPALKRLGCVLECSIDVPSVIEEAQATGLPRAVAAMRSLAPRARGGVVVVGTAPSALLALLDMVDAGEAAPAVVVGTPVGFVAASEAKAELMDRAIPFITIEGARGGAALAAAATNALIAMALARPTAAG